MVDPFFDTKPTQGDSQKSGQEGTGTETTIESLLSQQEQIQNKYKELKELLTNESLTENQKNEIQEQMQKLSDLYSQNKTTLAALTTNISGEKEIHVNKNINTDGSGSRSFSFKKFMIGCGILLLLFLGGLVAIFYSLINNPSRLSTFGIDGCMAVNLLQLFSIVFFGLIFFLGLFLFLVNLSRLITTKNKRKGGYFIGSVLSFILMVVIAFLLVTMLNRLSVVAEDCEILGDTQLVHSYAKLKNSKFKQMDEETKEYRYLIAPINIQFVLNQVAYKSEISTKLGSFKPTSVILECGNGQELKLGSNNENFEGTCFYTQKGIYQPTLVVNYLDTVGTPTKYEVPIQSINIVSEISVVSEQTKIESLNSSLLVGKNPVKLKFDASAVFRDYNLPNYSIRWCSDCMCDGERDNVTSVEYQKEYLSEGVFDVCVSFPSLGDQVYSFPIRVDQGSVASELSVTYEVTTSNPSIVYENPESIEISQLPTTLVINIKDVSPNSLSLQKKLYKDGEQRPADFSDSNLFKIVIDEDKDQTIVLEISDPERQLKTEKTINIYIKRENIIGRLLVSPDTVGTSPFEVRLDASTTTLNDSNDEIVFFSWDFGDGVKNKDTSEAIVSHIYTYDFANENGVYYPSVVLGTKNGLSFTISGVIISIKKPETNLEIFLENNPAQIASVGENVLMSVVFDGIPKRVFREFGDGETYECDGRSCSEVSHIYKNAGTYPIKAKVEFEDRPTIDGKINLLVQ